MVARHFFTLIFLLFSVIFFAQESKKYVAVVHGGAGWIQRDRISAEQESEYRKALSAALQKAYEKIQAGETAEKAVIEAVVLLENSPLFNAGVGAVMAFDGTHQLDASIMIGKNKKAGAVAGVKTIKNPILAAMEVMENSPHVLLSGRGAEEYAESKNLEMVENSYFTTEEIRKKWQDMRNTSAATNDAQRSQTKLGTVGAVALDKEGNLAAGTSTGGMMMKKWDRIGDSPIIGAGTYASDLVGVSSTGWGEYYIKSVAAFDVYARMAYSKKNVKEACKEVLQVIENLGGNGGIIALDKDGNVSMDFNTPGMFRGVISETGEVEIYFYSDEPR